MQFNSNKCKVVSVGRGNPYSKYTMNNEALEGLEYEKDLEVMISSDVGLREHRLEIRQIV